MILSEKLYRLREKSGLSQEQLANHLKVSRQSVSKWENGTSIPSMDKIVELSNLYGISIDTLLKDSGEQIPNEIVLDCNQEKEVKELSLEQVTTYLAINNKIRIRIASGIWLFMASMVPFLLLRGLSLGGYIALSYIMVKTIGVAIFTIMISAAMLLLIINNRDIAELKTITGKTFKLAYGVKDELLKRKHDYLTTYYVMIAIGIILCIIGTIQHGLITDLYHNLMYTRLSEAVGLTCVSTAVFIFIYSSQVITGYNKLIHEKTCEHDEDGANYKNTSCRFTYAIRRGFWPIVIAFYLLVSFLTGRWDLTWIIFIAASGIDKLLRAL